MAEQIDWDRVDEAALALLSLTLHTGDAGEPRAWKGLGWDITDRLHERGWIHDPRGKAKSVVFTEDGVRAAADLRARLFRGPEAKQGAAR